MLQAIDVRTHNNFARQASLHGAKIQLKQLTPSKIEIPDNSLDDKKAMDALMEAQKRVRARYGR